MLLDEVQAGGRGVEADVELDRPAVQVLRERLLVGRMRDQPAPGQVVKQRVHGSYLTSIASLGAPWLELARPLGQFGLLLAQFGQLLCDAVRCGAAASVA